MRVIQIPLLRDNYGYLIVCEKTKEAGIVDPSEAEPVLRSAEKEGVQLKAILNTHHHRDHTGGNTGLLERHSLSVYGHRSDAGRIPGLTNSVDEGDKINIGHLTGMVYFIPGHTRGHVAYLFEDNLFCGDTLFAAGCGRLFEGTADQMLDSLKRLSELPQNTRVYCGHEYTEKNLQFAATLEPNNPVLREKLQKVQAMRAKGVSTVPSTIKEERETNPFLRWKSKEIQGNLKNQFPNLTSDPITIFRHTRQLKDAF